MEFVGQTVPDRNTRVRGKLFDNFLAEAAVFDAVVHSAEDLRRVGNRFLLSHLAAAGVQIRHAHAQVTPGDFERAARAGRGFFKQQDNILALQIAVRRSGALEVLEVVRQLEQIPDFCWRVVDELQKVSSSDVDRHKIYLLYKWNCNNYRLMRSSGMLMQRGPPLPLDSSELGISSVSMPQSFRI